MPYELHASREEAGFMKKIMELDLSDDAAAQDAAGFHVEQLDNAGRWPEGHDAVLVAPDGRFWVLEDEWYQGLGVMRG
jgi:hypothetical protein